MNLCRMLGLDMVLRTFPCRPGVRQEMELHRIGAVSCPGFQFPEKPTKGGAFVQANLHQLLYSSRWWHLASRDEPLLDETV